MRAGSPVPVLEICFVAFLPALALGFLHHHHTPLATTRGFCHYAKAASYSAEPARFRRKAKLTINKPALVFTAAFSPSVVTCRVCTLTQLPYQDQEDSVVCESRTDYRVLATQRKTRTAKPASDPAKTASEPQMPGRGVRLESSVFISSISS